jgi:hypothetical protein
VIDLSTYLYLELFAAAALALWVIARFPQFGPKSLVPAAVVAVLAFAVGQLAPSGIVVVATSTPAGVYAALACVLLVLFVMLLTTAWLLRAMLRLLNGAGGGGGGGHHVPSH